MASAVARVLRKTSNFTKDSGPGCASELVVINDTNSASDKLALVVFMVGGLSGREWLWGVKRWLTFADPGFERARTKARARSPGDYCGPRNDAKAPAPNRGFRFSTQLMFDNICIITS